MATIWKISITLLMVFFLSNCTSLNGKCDYIPPNNCGCEGGACGVFWSPYCKNYLINQVKYDPRRCGATLCTAGSCANTWSCGKYYQFYDK